MRMHIVISILIFTGASAGAQNMGIGTSAPTALLHVNGSFRLSNGTEAANRVLTTNAAGLATWQDLPASASYWQAAGFGLGILYPGTVSINNYQGKGGTSLFVHGNILAEAPLTTNIDDYHYSYPELTAGSYTFWYADKGALIAGGISTTLDVTSVGKNSIALGLDNKAVGIASLSTGYQTQARGWGSAAFGFGVITKARGSAAFGTFNLPDNFDDRDFQSDRIFQVGNGSSDADRRNAFTILRNGNVGIGAIYPEQALEVVAGPSGNPTRLVIANKGGFGPAVLEFVSDYGLASKWRPGYIGSNDNGGFTGRLEFFTNGTGSNNLYGSVKGLEVRNGAALTATGSVGSFSDARLKSNIEPFTDGLNVIEQINPVSFQYIPNAPFATTNKQVGIVAQELEKAAPYMVHQTKEGNMQDMRWVDNQAYVFILINAMKELHQQLKAQQAEIEKLKRQLR